MPVPAVIVAGMPTVSSGSQITTAARIFGWKMIFFSWVTELETTPARPTSEPVPAVVGTAMIGVILSASARVHQSPTSSKSQTGRVCPHMKATILPRSSPEPPPKAITPSCPPSLKALMPCSRLISLGFGSTSANSALPRPACSSRASVLVVIGKSASPRSVTSSGLRMPAALQASAISLMRPAPNRIVVGYDQFAVSCMLLSQ